MCSQNTRRGWSPANNGSHFIRMTPELLPRVLTRRTDQALTPSQVISHSVLLLSWGHHNRGLISGSWTPLTVVPPQPSYVPFPLAGTLSLRSVPSWLCLISRSQLHCYPPGKPSIKADPSSSNSLTQNSILEYWINYIAILSTCLHVHCLSPHWTSCEQRCTSTDHC